MGKKLQVTVVLKKMVRIIKTILHILKLKGKKKQIIKEEYTDYDTIRTDI